MIKRVPTLVLLVVTMMNLARPALAAKQYDFRDSTLENGLRVVTLEDFSSAIVAVHVWYQVGSKNEDPERQGFAHMFEHMMFRGTDNLGPEEHFDLIRQVGGTANAFTSFDYTAYVNELPSNQLDLALWLEAERMMFLHVDQEGFDTERRVVEEERRQDLNQPYGTIFERLMPVLFKHHPYRWLPIGQIDHLRAAQLGELQHFWDTYYVPGNATLVIVGAIKHEEALEKARKYFGWMPALPKTPNVPEPEPDQGETRTLELKEALGPVPQVEIIHRGVKVSHPDRVPLEVLMSILGGGDSSRLYEDLVKQRRICQGVYAYQFALDQDGLLMTSAELMPGGDIEGTLGALEEHINRVRTEPVSDTELEKVKNQMRRRVITDTLTNGRKANLIGKTTLQYGGPDWLNEQLAAIEKVDIEAVQRVAKMYFDPSRRTIARIIPDKDFVYEPPTGANTSLDTLGIKFKAGVTRPSSFPNKPPLNNLLAELPVPEQVEQVMPNGLKVVVLPNHEAPFVTAVLGFRYGAWTENASAPGTASMALSMLTKGTEKYSALELAEIIEYNALTLRGSATDSGAPSMDVGQVAATALADKFPLAMELLAEVVLRPTFPQEELDILKDQQRLELSVREKDPGYLADRELRQRLFPNHPYSREASGELADIDKISVDGLKQWYRAFARPDTSVLYVAGDVKPKQVFRLVKQHLGDFKADGPTPAVTPPVTPVNPPTHIFLIDVPGSTQSQIRAGQVSINRLDPAYHATRVFTQIYGGGFNSRLNRSLRIEKGLTYGVSGYFQPYLHTGAFLNNTFTKTETTAETVQALLDVIAGMRTTPAAGPELESAKAYLVGSFARQLETPEDVLSYQWLIEAHNLPKDYLQRAMNAYAATTTEDIRNIAENILDPEHLTIVVVGAADAIKDDLAKIAPVTLVGGTASETPAATSSGNTPGT